MRVHFICRGNTSRSVIAEAYLKSLHIPNLDTSSSGTVAEQYRHRNVPTLKTTIKLLAAHGIGNTKTSADQLSQSRLHDEDMTIFMNQVVYDEAKQSYNLPANAIVWNIVDAGEGARRLHVGDDPYKYNEAIYKDIQISVDQLATKLIH
jgi:protein-tyrosine-phosphatase